jgi:hypothetical protein
LRRNASPFHRPQRRNPRRAVKESGRRRSCCRYAFACVSTAIRRRMSSCEAPERWLALATEASEPQWSWLAELTDRADAAFAHRSLVAWCGSHARPITSVTALRQFQGQLQRDDVWQSLHSVTCERLQRCIDQFGQTDMCSVERNSQRLSTESPDDACHLGLSSSSEVGAPIAVGARAPTQPRRLPPGPAPQQPPSHSSTSLRADLTGAQHFREARRASARTVTVPEIRRHQSVVSDVV